MLDGVSLPCILQQTATAFMVAQACGDVHGKQEGDNLLMGANNLDCVYPVMARDGDGCLGR